MNKIYKVIWSKAKHTYVVASEIAKGHTKGETTGKGLKRLAAALLVAAALMGPNYAWAADIVKVEPAADTASTTAVEVYTKDGAEKEISTLSTLIGNNATQIGNNATQIGNNATNIKSNTDKISKLESAVGDDDSGLKKDVNDLKTTVGDSTGGLVKDVADSKTAIDNEAAVRQSADKQLQTNIENEAAAREAEDARLNSEIVKTNTSLNEAASNLSKLNDTVAKGFEDLSTEDKTLQTNIENEAATRESADSALDSRTSALEAKTGSLNRVAAANSTSINESMTLKDKQYSATLQVNGSGAQIGVVNNSVAGLANDGGTAYTEYRARTGAILSKATNDISSTSSNGQVVDTAGDTTGEYSQAATAKSTGTTFTYSNDGGKTSSSTIIKGNSVSTGTVSATAGITDETTKDGTSVIASQTVGQNLNALDERITNVKEYLENQTSENYVSKADAAVQDGAVVKAANTIGENVTNLDAALAKETAARLGADKAQDKVIQQVNDNLVQSVNTINKNVADGFNALNAADANEAKARADADAAEKAARIDADAKLAGAVNSSISLSDENVLQKNTTSVDADGNVTTGKADVTEMILNKGGDHQITLSENGIKVGLNSGVMDKDGFYAGADDYAHASAALKSDGSIKGADGKFTVDGTTGNVSTKGSLAAASGTIGNVSMSADGTVTGVKDLTASGKVTADSFTDGTATMSNGSLNGVNQINATGNIVTTDKMQAHDMTATGTITGQNINGTTGTFGSLSTTGNASVGGTLTTNGITNTGNTTTDSLTVKQGATVGGNLGVTGDITGKSLNVGTGAISGGQITGTGLDVGAGTIKTIGAVETGTLETTGNATIGGNLTVDKNLTVNGTFDAKTLSSTVDANNYTTINGGKTQSMNLKLDAATRETKSSASTFDENGSNTWAKDDDSIGKSTVTADGISQKLSDTGDNPTVYAERTMSQGTDKKYSMVDTVKDGDKTNVASQTASESSSVVSGKDGENNYKSYITQNLKKILQKIEDGDGNVLTSTEQTETDITNTAEKGTIANNAQNIINHASENMTNTVGKNLETTVGGNKNETVTGTSTETVTGKKTENYNGGLETTVTGEEKHTVNGNQNITVNGTKSETVTGDVTEDYQSNMTTTVGKDQKTIVKGSQTNEISGSQTNTIGGDQTTTVTGDSSLTAENINNTAKNKITNKALDVKTDASSSIVNKVSNDYGSNTSTQLSYETKEEMSQADGKTASYLRSAAEEKSQLIDGDKKTTIDTVAGQTNTNITDGTNTSNDLQKADQIASSVTDGTNTTVVNQNAKSLASSITDGTKANNTNSTVDKSEQLIKASDTQYSATSKTATKMEDALVSGGSVIDVIKNLDDAANPFIGSAVTDGTNSTGVTQTAKDITNTAKNGTIANEAKDITNNATENMTNTVGKNLETTVGGEMKTTVTGNVTEDFKADLSTTVGGNKSETVTGTSMETVTRKKTENYNGGLETTVTGDEKHTVNGNQSNTVKGTLTETVTGDVTEDYKANLSTKVGGNQTTTVTGDSSLSAKNITNTATEKLSNSAAEIENSASKSITDKVGDNVSRTMTTSQIKESVVDGANSNTSTKTGSKDMNIVTDGTSTSTLSQLAGSVNTSLKEVYGEEKTTKSLSNVKTVSEDTTKITDTTSGAFSSSSQKADSITSVVKDTEKGTVSERSQTVSQVQDKVGTTTVTTTDGLTKLTNEAGTHNTQMDFAEVLKDLGVRGNAVVDGTSTLKGDVTMESNASVGKNLTVKGDTTMEGNASVGKDLTVAGKSTLTGDVTMESNATVEKDLTVNGKSTLKGGLEVTNGTTTDTLKVTGSSEFDGKATFNDIVTMNKGLSVTGGVTADTVTADTVTADSYKVGDKTYIDKDGINANNQVIRNVGQGNISEGSTDAVSGGQLYETNTRVSGLETRMGTVETKVDKLDGKIDKVGANAAAMANLHPLEFDEDSKWNIAAAVGSSGSETASAVGVFYRPNENVMVNASAAMGTGENMFGGGVSLRLGHGGNKAKEAQMKAAAAENKELRAKVDDLTARMDALLSVLNPNMSKDFPDVPENHWAYEAVSRLAGNGIVEGYEDGKYHGERQMTRYEMAEIIYNALSKGAKAEKKLVEEFRPELQAMAAQKKA